MTSGKIVFIVLGSFLLGMLPLQAALSAQQLYVAVQRANEARFPAYFSAKLSGAALTLQFKNIPAEMIEFGKRPELHFHFKKYEKPRLLLKHVSPFYQNFFSPYEATLSQSGLFLGVDRKPNYTSFARTFEVLNLQQTAEGADISLREREGLPGDHATYYFTEDWLLKRALFYEAEALALEIKFYYSRQGKYMLPKRLLLYLKADQLAIGAQRSVIDDDDETTDDHIFFVFSAYQVTPPAVSVFD